MSSQVWFNLNHELTLDLINTVVTDHRSHIYIHPIPLPLSSLYFSPTCTLEMIPLRLLFSFLPLPPFSASFISLHLLLSSMNKLHLQTLGSYLPLLNTVPVFHQINVLYPRHLSRGPRGGIIWNKANSWPLTLPPPPPRLSVLCLINDRMYTVHYCNLWKFQGKFYFTIFSIMLFNHSTLLISNS